MAEELRMGLFDLFRKQSSDDFGRLKKTKHMLNFLSKDPFVEMKKRMEDLLSQQISGTKIDSIKVVSDPEWFTGVIEKTGQVTRSGVAFDCSLQVTNPDGSRNLECSFVWVGVNLDKEMPRTRCWIDPGVKVRDLLSSGTFQQRTYFELS